MVVVTCGPVPAATAPPSGTSGYFTWITPSPPVTCTEDRATSSLVYQSSGRSYSATLFRPTGGGPFPAMLVLHSGNGLTGQEFAYGRWLADHGYVALMPDYFLAVGIGALHPDPVALPWGRIREDLARAVDCLRAMPSVTKSRVGAVGFSLGGYFALALGTRDDVQAVVSYSTGIGPPVPNEPDAYPGLAAKMRASVLLLEGGDEPGAATIRALQASLTAEGKRSDLVSYPGAGHVFNFSGPDFPGYDASATADAQARTLAFLQTALR